MKRLGFVGTGAITAAIVRGLKGSHLRDWPITLSPRNAEISANLASSFSGVRTVRNNQAVIDGSEIVFLAVRPQDAPEIIPYLRFRADQCIISLVAALTVDKIREWTGIGDITRAIPLPFVEQRTGVTPITPPNPFAAEIFGALGDCIQVTDINEFDGYATAGALMATYFGILEAARNQLVAEGMRSDDTELYLRNLFGNLGDVLRRQPAPLNELRASHSTRGGLNELACDTFMSKGGGAALAQGISAVIDRIRSSRL